VRLYSCSSVRPGPLPNEYPVGACKGVSSLEEVMSEATERENQAPLIVSSHEIRSSSGPEPSQPVPTWLQTVQDFESTFLAGDIPNPQPSTPILAFIRSVGPRRAESLTFPNPGNVDIRSLDYVTTPNENLLCPICTSPFVSPVELDCEHVFCEDCLYDHLQSGIQSASFCPKCRNSIEDIQPVPKLLNQLLDELEVLCPNKQAGCMEHHKRYTMNDHVNNYCDFTKVGCPAVDCLLLVPRRFLEERCPHNEVECDQCEKPMMELELGVSVQIPLPSSFASFTCHFFLSFMIFFKTSPSLDSMGLLI
jgi:hypothetical protein